MNVTERVESLLGFLSNVIPVTKRMMFILGLYRSVRIVTASNFGKLPDFATRSPSFHYEEFIEL